MSNVKNKDKKKYAEMWAKSKIDPSKSKKKSEPLVEGKAQARIESMGWDQTSNGNDCIKVEMKCLSGPNANRTMYRTFYIQGDENKYGTAEENTARGIAKFKEEMANLGVDSSVSPDEAMESLEDCVIEVSLWRGKDKKDKYPIIFFNKFVKGPEGEDEPVKTEQPKEEAKAKTETASEPEAVKEETAKVQVDEDDVEY